MIAFLYHRDPRSLLLAAGGTAFCFSTLQSTAVSCISLTLALGFSTVSSLPWRILLKRFLEANVFTLFLWLTVPWTMPGTNLFTLGPLAFSREGIALATLVSLKCNAILLASVTLTADMDIQLMGYALERLHLPLKLVFLFLFTCRYIHTIGEEWAKLQTAAMLRGFVPRTSLHTYKTIGNMIGLTLINSVDRSHKTYEAMLLRGFNEHFLILKELNAKTSDVVFVLFVFGILACLLYADCYVMCNHV